MATPRAQSIHQEPPNAVETRRLIERRNDEAREAVLANGGRSAPHSAAESSGGRTPEEDWRKLFPNKPGAGPLSVYGSTAPAVQPRSLIAPPAQPAEIGDGPGYEPPPTASPVLAVAPSASGVLNPYLPHAGVPAINNPRPQTSPSVVHPQSTNYLGETRYFDPTSGTQGNRVIDIDPSKDQRFAVNGQTSGAQTAQGILNQYQTHGTVASFKPGNVTADNGTTMAPGGAPVPYDYAAARTATLAAHPNIGINGTAENDAFVAHAQQHGEQSAHANLPSILANVKQPQVSIATSTQPKPLSPY